MVPTFLPASASLALAGAGIAAPALLTTLLFGCVAFALATSALLLVRQALARDRRLQTRLRLVPTANAWGYSDRATLDESAVGL